MKMLKRIGLFLASAAGLTQSAAALPLVKAEHAGTYECVWPDIETRATFVLNTEEGSLYVNWRTHEVAGYVNVVSSPKAVIYSVGDASGSGRLAFLPDGRVSVGTGNCTKQ